MPKSGSIRAKEGQRRGFGHFHVQNALVFAERERLRMCEGERMNAREDTMRRKYAPELQKNNSNNSD